MSTALAILGNGLLLSAFGVFVIGFIARMVGWYRIPVPLKIPTTPAPKTLPGVLSRVATEVFVFRSLFKADKALWVGGYVFHVSFALIILRHMRYFIDPMPRVVLAVQTIGVYAGFAMVLSLAYLLYRRAVFERVRYVTTFADYFAILLIMAIGITGLWMRYIDRVFVIDVKNFAMGALTLQMNSPPAHPVFWLHLCLVATLIVMFPFSKLMHSGGIFFSPTRNQRDNPRDRRYINPWNDTFPDPTEYTDGEYPPIDEL
ncbi:MAG: nitrate reductase [Euryarchaeota archaeon]|nr:nitrate reductase [Euryarchaeota archaeon]